MNEIQERIEQLRANGWTLAAIADAVGVHWFTAQRWANGEQYPNTPKPVLMLLDGLTRQKRVPKQRRYKPGSRVRKDS